MTQQKIANMITTEPRKRTRKFLSKPWQAVKRWLYIWNGRVPWSFGYSVYKRQFLQRAVQDLELLERFRTGKALPMNYAYRLDERAIEIPWILSHLPAGNQALLDAGGVLAHRSLATTPLLTEKRLYACSITPENISDMADNLSWIQADLRELGIADSAVDLVCCVSTLEHVGMDNTLHYAAKQSFRENAPQSYRQAVIEMRRVLRPGGLLLLTVPFGIYQNMKWQQQFDAQMIEDVIALFEGETLAVNYFKFTRTGWQVTSQAACNGCRYFNYLATPINAPDFAPAARAVACLYLRKPQ